MAKKRANGKPENAPRGVIAAGFQKEAWDQLLAMFERDEFVNGSAELAFRRDPDGRYVIDADGVPERVKFVICPRFVIMELAEQARNSPGRHITALGNSIGISFPGADDDGNS
jgi:hypothetical protein